MGVIEDGTVKGNLPSKDVFGVHYPGYPSSLSRAVQTLGGLDAFSKVHSSKVNKLELHFRPEDPFSHPAFGQLHPCNGLLLRVSKNNAIDSQNNGCSGSQSKDTSTSISISTDIVARLHEAYHFDGMVDYQYVLPVHANAGQSKIRMNEATEPIGCSDEADDDELMILVPPQFSPKDVPENIVERILMVYDGCTICLETIPKSALLARSSD